MLLLIWPTKLEDGSPWMISLKTLSDDRWYPAEHASEHLHAALAQGAILDDDLHAFRETELR